MQCLVLDWTLAYKQVVKDILGSAGKIKIGLDIMWDENLLKVSTAFKRLQHILPHVSHLGIVMYTHVHTEKTRHISRCKQ